MDYNVIAKNNAGSTEHYYHFLFGLLLPFVQNVNANSEHTFYFKSCGPLNKHFEIPGYKTAIGNQGKNISFAGFDFTDYRNCNLNLIKKKLFDAFEIVDDTRNEILFVDRDKPDPFYQTVARMKGSGSYRRHIPNIDEVVDLVGQQFRVKKVFLENMSLREQIQTFRNAPIIVLQHGAAMSNIIWCKEKTLVIEIRNRQNLHCYDALARRAGLRLKKLPIQINNFSKINPGTVLSHLKNDPSTIPFLNHT